MRNFLHNLPSDFLSNSEKNSDDFGLSVAKVIDEDWFGSGRLTKVREWITENRQYSRGEQKTDYQSMIEGKREKKQIDLKTHKIDYTKLIKVLPVFKDTIVNSIDESLFKPRAEAIDIKAVNTKKDYFKKLDEDFATRDVAQVISEGIGVNLVPQDLPDNPKDLEVLKIEYKPDIEIAQELAIENVMKHQNFESIKDACDEDLFDLGYCVLKQYTDPTEGIKLAPVDPYFHGHSDFERKDGSDIRYHFEIKRDTIANLAKLSGGLSAQELKTLRNRAVGDYKRTDEYDESLDGDRLIEYIHFVYLVPKSEIFKKHKKNGITKLIDRNKDEEEYNPSRKSRKLEIPYNTWYEGIYVPQDEILIKWKQVDDQIEESANTPICPFIMYAPRVKKLSEKGYIRFESLVDRAKPIVDDMQRDWFKFQQLKMELRPNTVEVDVDAINNVVLNGQKIPAQTILDLYFGRGIMLKNKYDEEGDEIQNAVSETLGGINNTALGFLSQEFSANYERLRALTGINELKSGISQPSDRTPAKIQKVLLANSNNNVSHLVKASFNVSLKVAQSISLRLIDVLNSKKLRDMYMNIIGTTNVELLDVIKKIPMHEFGIYFDFKPDDEERVAFEKSLITELDNQGINTAQYNTARQIRNVKNAIKYLGITIEENIKKAEERKIAAQRLQGEINAKSAVVAEQAKQQTITINWETKRQELLLKDKLESGREILKAKIKEMHDSVNHDRNLEIEIIKGQNSQEHLATIEAGKEKRIDQVSTNTSIIADQKANKKPPITFNKQNSTNFIENLDNIINS